jgi:hypothetical protein
MQGKSRTGFIVVVAIAVLLATPALSGCGSQITDRFAGIVKSLNPPPTATSAPPTATPAAPGPSPTSQPPTPVPPTSTVTPVPTRAPTLTPSITPTPAPDAVVTADALTLRGGPGTAYARIGTLLKGGPLTVTARTKAGDWLAVTTQGGKKGWVSAAYVQLNKPLDQIPVTSETPPTPVPSPTRTPTEPSGESQAAQASPTPTPPGSPIDEQIDQINAGKHGQLPQPPMVSGVAAGGESEVTILNDTPFALTVLIGSPNQTTVTVEKCPTCSTYGSVGPLFCQEEGRPRQTIRVKPGTMKVAARVDNPSVIPFSGEWTLSADSAYFNCFFIVTQ